MYSRRSGLIIGFHGCDESIQKKVLLGGDLKLSNNSWDWLGKGVYFWENNPEGALDFAKEQSKRKNSKIMNPSVIGAIIDLGECLDLMDKKSIEIVKEAYITLKESKEASGVPLPQNTNPNGSKSLDLLHRHLDCAVINSLEDVVNFDSAKGIFTEGEPIYENAEFREKDHIQICIRNMECIKGYFLPKNLKSNFSDLYDIY